MTNALNLSLTSFKCREQNAMHNMKFDIDFGKNQKAGNIQRSNEMSVFLGKEVIKIRNNALIRTILIC